MSTAPQPSEPKAITRYSQTHDELRVNVAALAAQQTEPAYECRCCLCYAGFIGDKRAVVCPRCIRVTAERSATIAAPAPARGDDAALREEIAGVLFRVDQQEPEIFGRMADAILASYILTRRA